MTESKPDAKVDGTHLLTEKDFVDVVDADGEDLPQVPKHWTVNDLPAGAKFKKAPAKKAAASGGGSSRSRGAKKAAAKKTAAPAGATSTGDAGSDDKSGDDSSE